MSKIEPITRAPGSRAFTVHDVRPFSARPVCAAGRGDRSATGPYATHYTATASFLYITRTPGSDHFGPVPDSYLAKDDLLGTGRFYPEQRMPPALKSGPALWIEADNAAAEVGPEEVSAIHLVASLPLNVEPGRWPMLVKRFCFDHVVSLGMIVDTAIHAKADEDGWCRAAQSPHVRHLPRSARQYGALDFLTYHRFGIDARRRGRGDYGVRGCATVAKRSDRPLTADEHLRAAVACGRSCARTFKVPCCEPHGTRVRRHHRRP